MRVAAAVTTFDAIARRVGEAMPVAALAILVAVSVAALVGVAFARALVIAQPDEWLLCIRNGRLVNAGIGIQLWRRPGDVVARFTSTMQRVGFTVDALSNERLPVSVQGFILWSVSAEGEGPFRAFRKLGLVNLDAPPRDLKTPKHLLSTPQHRAFQQLLGAAVQRLAATRSLEDLLLRQDALVLELTDHLAALERQMGIRVDQIELLQVRPVDADLLKQLSAEVEGRLRERAANIELETTERAKRRAIESDARIAHEQAEARRQQLETEQSMRLVQIGREREVMLRKEEAEREQALAIEARAIEVTKAVLARQELELAARLDRIRREAVATAEATSLVAGAEERKSQPVREYELARLVAEKVGDALGKLPIHDARWITVGPDSPAGSIAALVTAARELTSGRSKAA